MKKTVAILIAVLMTVSLASCFKSKTPTTNDINTETADPGRPDDNRDDIQGETPKQETQETEKSEEKTAEITYNGRIDMNFIEVSFAEGEYGIMKLSEDMQKSFDSLDIVEGANLKVVYTEKDGQKIITGIKQ